MRHLVDFGARADVPIVGDYQPTMFGFGKHRRGCGPQTSRRPGRRPD